MRKFIVRHFFLDYFYNILGWRFNGVRAATIIVPIMSYNGLLMAYTDELSIVGMTLLILALFCGFVYPKAYPLQVKDWDILDETQKLQYGFHQEEMTAEMFKEWSELYTKYNSK